MSRLLLLSAASLLATSLATAALAQNASLTTSGTAAGNAQQKSAPAPRRNAPPPSQTPQNSEQFVGPNASGCPIAGAVTNKGAAAGPGPHCPPYEGSSSLGGNGTGTARSHPADTGR